MLAHNGHEAISAFSAPGRASTSIVIDIGLPDADGRDVCQALRAGGQHAPALFLTALDAVHDRISGFNAGGDDYVREAVLGPRCWSVYRRAAQAHPARAGARVTGFRLDPERLALRTARGRRGHPDRVPAAGGARGDPRGRRPATHRGGGWPDGAMVSENTLDSYVRRLRVKLALVESPVRLETVRGVGYVLQ